MIEFEPQELAMEFAADSTSIKRFRGAPLTMEELEQTREKYLASYPAPTESSLGPSTTTNLAPSLEMVTKGTYIHDRFRNH